MRNNFCSQLQATKDLVISACPKSTSGRCTYSEFAYWQWASSYFTLNPSLELNVKSVALIDDSIFGFPEISYFKDHFMEKTASNPKVQAAFKDVSFGDPYKEDTKFYSWLFYLPDVDY